MDLCLIFNIAPTDDQLFHDEVEISAISISFPPEYGTPRQHCVPQLVAWVVYMNADGLELIPGAGGGELQEWVGEEAAR